MEINLSNLFTKRNNIESRSLSAENFRGEKAKDAQMLWRHIP
ncbi:MAG: hypothetical protein WBD63_09445 [Phycisphaerae bacterium]|nr:hypothetical protein [Phycisphaerae bacterium]